MYQRLAKKKRKKKKEIVRLHRIYVLGERVHTHWVLRHVKVNGEVG